MSGLSEPESATATQTDPADTLAAPPNTSAEPQSTPQPIPTNLPPAATAESTAGTDAPPPLSKKAKKRLAKAAYLEERKKERRAAEKERRKERKRLLALKRAAGELDEEEDEEREPKRQKTGPRTPFNARVVVDLGFDEKMTENEVKSLSSQLAYTYSANKKATHPISSLLFTSLNGRTLARLEATNNAAYKRWVGAEWWTEGYERLWEGEEDTTPTISDDQSKADAGGDQGREAKRTKKHQPSRAARDAVIYLTADADDELTELKEGETYIIGGIVDHNRYKNLCLEKSKEHQVRSARLPIGTYLSELRTRKVLTVNQTFEILLKWIETRDWEQALYSVIPKRKFNTSGRRRGGGGSSKGGESGDEGDDAAGGDDESEDDHDDSLNGDVEAKVIDVAALEEEDTQPEAGAGVSSGDFRAIEVEEAIGQ